MESERFRATFLSIRVRRSSYRGRLGGSSLQVGEAALEVRGAIPRCAVVDLDPVTGERDATLLKALGPEVTFAVDAVVTRPGRVRVGDEVVA